MARTLEKRLNEWQESFDQAMYDGDIGKIMSEFYHPQAALVAYGKVSFGLEAIRTAWTQFIINEVKGKKFETRYEWTAEADGDKRIFFKMTMWPSDDKSKVSKGIMELVKGDSGKYVIYRDYFEP
ncbi:hypothetical protein AAVH_15888 [Aphelenchoides avenae]|nr:hypothetical protein AAVH_15888 [Aphelenchus avenae]